MSIDAAKYDVLYIHDFIVNTLAVWTKGQVMKKSENCRKRKSYTTETMEFESSIWTRQRRYYLLFIVLNNKITNLK